MQVIILRHFKVKHTWKKSCTSAEFDEECRRYDEASIETVNSCGKYDSKKVYVSTLGRSLKSAEVLFGARDFCRTRLIDEVPLRSAFDSKLRFPLWFWNVSGRLQWFCNNKRQKESRLETIDRAKSFVKELAECGTDSAVVTHGFFMHTLIKQMKLYGFRAGKTVIHYDNGEAIVLVRDNSAKREIDHG